MKKFGNRENECVKLQDGREVWLSRSIAVVAMVTISKNDRTYVLMGKRGPGCPDEVGKWVMPCGYLDYDETLVQAMVRETFEETGFDIYEYLDQLDAKGVSLLDRMLFNNWEDPVYIKSSFADGAGPQNVSVYFRLELPSLNPFENLPTLTIQNRNEVSELQWVDLDIVCDYDIGFNHEKSIRWMVKPRLPQPFEWFRRILAHLSSRAYDLLR